MILLTGYRRCDGRQRFGGCSAWRTRFMGYEIVSARPYEPYRRAPVVVDVTKSRVCATMTSWSPWDNPSYCWVVICKNKRFHRHANTMFGHKIPLAETDAVSAPPAVSGPFVVQGDECGEEYTYRAEEVLRVELGLSESFVPHPLFRES